MTNLASCIAFWPRFPICFLLLCRSVSIRDWSCCSCQLLKTAAARFEDKSVCISIASSLHRLVSKFIQFNDGHLLSLLIIVSGKNGMHSRFKAAVHRHAPIRSDAISNRIISMYVASFCQSADRTANRCKFVKSEHFSLIGLEPIGSCRCTIFSWRLVQSCNSVLWK
jgi:hypothetical protein